MMIAACYSKKVMEFFKSAGIYLNKKDSATNVISLVKEDGEKLELWAGIDSSLPLLHVDEKE